MKKLLVIDAMNLAYRSFYALGANFNGPSGQPVAAVFGSAMALAKLLDEERPDYVVVCTDGPDKTFRHDLYPQYKANRKAMPPELVAQLQTFFDLFSALGIPVIRQSGVEADDLIGSVARKFASPDVSVLILSGDKDFMQLVSPIVSILAPKKTEVTVRIDEAGVTDLMGVPPSAVIDVLALLGDASDNVPGIEGVGKKTAEKLIVEYGSVEGLYERLDSVKGKLREKLALGRESAILSKRLVTIKTDCAIDLGLDDLSIDSAAALSTDRALHFLKFHGFRALVSRGEGRRASLMGTTDAPTSGASSLDHDYRLVDTETAFAAMLDELSRAEILSFDTETTGLDKVNDRPIGVSLSAAEGVAYYVPLVVKHLTKDLTPAAVVDGLRSLLGRPMTKVGHNVKYDLQMLGNVGIDVSGPLVDTMIMDHLLDPDHRRNGIDDCCLRRLAYVKIPTSKLIGDKGEKSMLDAAIGELVDYACEDADYALRLHHVMLSRIRESDGRGLASGRGIEWVLREIEMPLVPVISRMERVGFPIATEPLRSLSIHLKSIESRLKAEIFELAGEEFNVASPSQLQKVLYEKLKIPELLGVKRLKKTKTGISTDESVLSKLTASPLVAKILEFRSVAKLRGTYVDGLPGHVNSTTGRIHANLHQNGAATGRMSSSGPSLMNLPIRSERGAEIRKACRAEQDGWAIVSGDFSQVELRLLAHLSKDEALLEAFASGGDIHRATAAKVFAIPVTDVTSDQRSRAKAINYGIVYGVGAKRLAENMKCGVSEAQAFIDRYFATYPGVKVFIDEAIRTATERGYTETMTGRRRYISGLSSGNASEAANARNAAVNTPIQGSAADLAKLAMIRIDRALSDRGLKTRMLLQVHDELLFEAPVDEVEIVTPLIREAMEHAFSLCVPLLVDIGAGKSWYDAH